MTKLKSWKRELTGLVAGSSVAGAVLVGQHYGLKRYRLKRTDAYIAGTLGLDAGYALYLALTGKGIEHLGAFFAVQVVGGATIKGVYRLDRDKPGRDVDDGQLIETLNDNERLRLELTDLQTKFQEAVDFEGHIHTDDLLELAAHATTAQSDLSRAMVSIEALLREHAALQQRLRITSIRKAASRKAEVTKRKAGDKPASG